MRFPYFFAALGIFISLAIYFRTAGAAPCPAMCKESGDKREVLQKSIKRLQDIRAVNLEFIAELSPSQESKRLKASSNVRIAEQRIGEAQAALASLDAAVKSNQCDTCEKI